jgi:predicted oxidoreductase (fatty acid repression mutant protein)
VPAPAAKPCNLALTQANVWTALAQENIGANLQHYNPVIDEAVAAESFTPFLFVLLKQ